MIVYICDICGSDIVTGKILFKEHDIEIMFSGKKYVVCNECYEKIKLIQDKLMGDAGK